VYFLSKVDLIFIEMCKDILENGVSSKGEKAAIMVLIGDVLKGVVSCLLGLYIFKDTGLMVAGAGAILGHNWPLYFNFKGGKGVLVSVSVLFMMDWKIEGELKASSELKLHLCLYSLRDDVGGIVHNHSPFATAYAIARKPIESKAYTEMIYFYDKIPVVDYGTPGTDKIAKGIPQYIHQTDVCLLANHGLVAVGTNAYDAYLKAEVVETLAKTLTITKLIGGEHPLSPQELNELYEMRKNK
jgi:L-ribulose-5-phosphate 4-epimerase